jgi:hypothetical protein
MVRVDLEGGHGAGVAGQFVAHSEVGLVDELSPQDRSSRIAWWPTIAGPLGGG